MNDYSKFLMTIRYMYIVAIIIQNNMQNNTNNSVQYMFISTLNFIKDKYTLKIY